MIWVPEGIGGHCPRASYWSSCISFQRLIHLLSQKGVNKVSEWNFQLTWCWSSLGNTQWVLATIAYCLLQGPRTSFWRFCISFQQMLLWSVWGLNQIPSKTLETTAQGLPCFCWSFHLVSPVPLLKRGMKNQNVSTIFSRQNNHWTLLALFNNSARFNWLKHNGVVCLPGTRRHPPLTQYDNGTWQKEIIYF